MEIGAGFLRFNRSLLLAQSFGGGIMLENDNMGFFGQNLATPNRGITAPSALLGNGRNDFNLIHNDSMSEAFY